MSYNESLAARIRVQLSTRNDVVEKKMFGGLCFMVNGAMCCGLTKSDFMVRVGPEQYDDALSQPHGLHWAAPQGHGLCCRRGTSYGHCPG